MTRGLYAIRDNVAAAIVGGVHVHANHAPAIRFFGDVAKAEGTQIQQHLDDHDLLCLGMMDDDSGKLDGFETPEVVLLGSTLRATWEAQRTSTNDVNG